MFISRKTIRMRTHKTNKVRNSQIMEMQSANPIVVSQNRMKNDVQIVRYPAFLYFVAFIMIVTFIYLLYSANGGIAGIPGFQQKLWWQYTLACIPIIIALSLFTFAQIESVCIYGDRICFSKSILLGWKQSELVERQVGDVLNVVIVKKGYQMVTFTNSSYFLVFNFKGYDQLEVLECASDITAVQYLTQINAALPKLRGTNKKITIMSMVVGG